jgi:hypothetical protein
MAEQSIKPLTETPVVPSTETPVVPRRKISAGEIFMWTWYATSLGLPVLTVYYVNGLGKTVGLEVLGTSGELVNAKTGERINIDEIGDYAFIRDLKGVQLAWIGIPFGFLSIPFCIGFMVKSTINYVRYIFRSRKNKKNKVVAE